MNRLILFYVLSATRVYWPFYLAGLALVFGLALHGCMKTNPPAPKAAWFCKTIADIQPDSANQKPEVYFRAVSYKDKFWPTGYEFKVGFLGGSASDQAFVKNTVVEWAKYANVKFTFPVSGPYDVRVAFDATDGAWSYVGIDCKSAPANEPTMNLGWLDSDVVWHEFGHTLGLLHEHQNPVEPIKWNEQAVIKDLSGPPNNWSVAMIRYNVLNTYPLPNVITTALDRVSVMMYPIPARWTLDGQSYPGGTIISTADRDFIAARYPFQVPPGTGTVTLSKGAIDTIIGNLDKNKAAFDRAAQQLKSTDAATRKALGR